MTKFKVGNKVWIFKTKEMGIVQKINNKIPDQKTATVTVTIKRGDDIVQEIVAVDEIAIYNKKDVILFAKVKNDAIIPNKRIEDGWYDIYLCLGEQFTETVEDKKVKSVTINPGEIKTLPTGIASSMLSKYRVKFSERGSTGTVGLAVRSGCIDSGYRDEWLVALNNTTNIPIQITNEVDKIDKNADYIRYPLSKAVCQAAVEMVPNVFVKEIPYSELKEIPSERKLGKFGSSGK